MSAIGFVQPGIMILEDVVLVRPRRQIGEFVAQVTLEEVHHDEMEITDHPVERGAPITDHAYKRPAEVIIRAGWSNSPGSTSLLGSLASAVTGTIGGIQSLLTGNSQSQVKEIYERFLALQSSRQPFDVYTGKRVYNDMLIKSLSTPTNRTTENSLVLTVLLRQIIMVSAVTTGGSVASAPDAQKSPGITNPTADFGTLQLRPPNTPTASQLAARALGK